MLQNRNPVSYTHLKSIELANAHLVDAVATTPINKESLRAGNVNFIGHTEIFGELTGTKDPLTMFEVRNMRVFFLTRHVSVSYTHLNTTRFIIVTNKKVFLEGAEKISLYFEVPHESGSLYNILSHIIFNNLNMTKIESRPMVERNWEYRFFVDFEGNLLEPGVRNALRGIRDCLLYTSRCV